MTAAAESALETYVETHHLLGHDITLSGLFAALHQPGVQNVRLTQPGTNIAVAADEAAFCAADALDISIGGRDV